VRFLTFDFFLKQTRHGIPAAKDSPIVLKCAITSESITSLKRSSTGVNCFLDTWTFFISSWGDLLIPLSTGTFLHLGWILLVPFICFLHALLLAVAPRTECLLGIFFCHCRGIDGSEEGHLQHNRCQGKWIFMQHTHGLGHELNSLLTINMQDDGGRLAVCAMTGKEAGDYVF
jgi:hypothetical protein